MKNAIRFFSKFGHTKEMVKVIEELIGEKALTVDNPITEPIDTLYLGAGVMLGKVDGSVMRFIETLKPDQVKRVICFGSSAIIKSPVPQMRKALESRGIMVDTKEFTCKGSMGPLHSGHPNQQDFDNFKTFIKTTL